MLNRAGELEEPKGNAEAAVARYAELLDLWKDADPELQPVVKEVRERVARLTARGG